MRRGLARSRQHAIELIGAGRVLVAGAVADKPARLVDAAEAVVVSGPPPPYVSRGGEKLRAALDHFGLGVDGVTALDAGASTGGFTDCLLQAGAAGVVAVDVGHGQLDQRLRVDPRVTVVERTNIRTAALADLGAPFEFVAADLSFISLRSVAANLFGALTQPGGTAVALVKPQFEAGRAEVSKGRGVIRDPLVWRRTLGEVRSALQQAQAAMMGIMVSPLRGADGNVEFLIRIAAGSADAGVSDAALDEVVTQATPDTQETAT